MKILKENKKIKRLVAILSMLSCINLNTSYANVNDIYNFKNITIEDGLSQSTIKTIYQDSKGYIWIGTEDGLNRYNGYDFENYKHDEHNKNSIINNYVIDIEEDKNGYIWVSTTNGLSRINTTNNEIKNYYSEKHDGNLLDSSLWKILSTAKGDIIVFGINGINVYDEAKDAFVKVPLNDNFINCHYIYSVEEDSNGNIWIGTDKGLLELDKNFKLVTSYYEAIGKSEVYNIYDDLKGNLWVCTLGDGLFRINLKDKSMKNYRYSTSKPSIPSNNIRDVINDSKGRLWIATDKGLCYFNYNNEQFTHYNNKSNDRNSLINSSILCLFKDKSGLMWVGTHKGISTFNPDINFLHFKSNPNDENAVSGDIIYGIHKDDDNLLWIGTSEQGVNIMDGKNTKYLHTENSDLLSNTIFDITGYKNKIFIATEKGISAVTKNNKKYSIKNYTEENGLPSNLVTYLFVDSNDNLLIGTNKGIAILKPDGSLIDITRLLDDIGVSDKFIGAIHEDSNGNYYIGCFLGGGLIKLNPNTKEYKLYKQMDDDKKVISNENITYMNEDLNGNMLIGTNNGLYILNTKDDSFEKYTEKEGLINNTVYGILVDNDNNIWISTNGGISKFYTKDKVFENFTVIDGLQSNEFNGRACFKSESGSLYFGGVNGFNVFNPNDIKLSTFSPKVVFDKFEVNGVNKTNISNTELKYNENNIKISFFTNDYANAGTTQYYYKLDG
ncbi:MAG: hypothetical protein IJ086_00840 [Clostridium sp.]|nr:hypothetical protein [Clostridium sp.]